MKNEIQKILVGYDFSNVSKHALEQGCALAEIFSAELQVIYVLDTEIPGYLDHKNLLPGILDHLEKKVSSEIDRIVSSERKDSLQWKTILKDGKPYSEIIKHAKTENMDLIVLGTHGYTGFERLILGSVTEKILRHAPCPVLVHRHTDTKGFRKILVPLDLGENSRFVLRYGAQLAKLFGAEMMVFHSLPLSNLMNVSDWGPNLYPSIEIDRLTKMLDEKYIHFMKEMKEELPELDEIDLKIEKRVGSPVSTILEMEKDHKRDLILMGSHEGKFTKFLLGSVAENIARYAKSSVWVLREKAL